MQIKKLLAGLMATAFAVFSYSIVSQQFVGLQSPRITYAEASALSDNPMTPGQLSKLFPTTVGTLNTSTLVPYAISSDIYLYNTVQKGTGNFDQIPVLQDLNGDGLVDMIFATGWMQFVLLNNGQGFDVVYYCQNKGNNEYQGSCVK